MSYSQSNEESVVLDYFGEHVGRFLDVGAYCDVFSNTLRLAELGWRGLAIEPDPHNFIKLLDTYARHNVQRVASLHAFVGTEPGIVKFYGSGGDGISTASEASRRRWEDQACFREFFVPAVTVRQVLERFGGTFEMVSVDAEGGSVDILHQMPLAEMGTRLVCVEHDGRESDVMRYCAVHGLTAMLLMNAENVICARPN